jgi:hypothetical protein
VFVEPVVRVRGGSITSFWLNAQMIGIKYRKEFIPAYTQFPEWIFQQVIEFSRTDSGHLFSYVQNHTHDFGGRLLAFQHRAVPAVINLSVYPEQFTGRN